MNNSPQNSVPFYRRGSWLITISVAVVSAIVFFAILKPGYKEINSIRTEVAEKRQRLQAAVGLNAEMLQTRQKIDRCETLLASWRKYIPTEQGLPKIFGIMQKISKNTGVSTLKFEPQAHIKLAGTEQIPVAMQCTGSFAQIFAFLREMETFNPLIWENRVNIENKSTTGEVAHCELSFTIFSDNPENSN